MAPYLLLLSVALLGVQVLPASCWPVDPAPRDGALRTFERLEMHQAQAATARAQQGLPHPNTPLDGVHRQP
ncbi:hypothetical protein [Aeromonas hydrophila]|uniref:hypothetical protein n=1 Tax=Aeromonas hydrophila TaxID=644 RepID=UPI000332ADF5|nr:hypothetical protein [Aeromonas hydrophila]AGM45059.1 hypothetical protein AHML_16455 [Aeromonas hydrophila ML09-119]AHX33693.1 hypothetical protein V428_17025 [Aeromonas hydrophila subsp. hydrophila AL09-71]AHX70494.1 hypothetical protein V429_17060 [Aeromonas hydrophila pc104A]AJE35526.1 hypothetical protein V469_06235 [Aeromonas hydrophila J-1]AKJ33721.1 hypothetical protein U876_06215 [Aeromonas hydrophila NJ-35]